VALPPMLAVAAHRTVEAAVAVPTAEAEATTKIRMSI
jgi:hypothetical protein